MYNKTDPAILLHEAMDMCNYTWLHVFYFHFYTVLIVLFPSLTVEDWDLYQQLLNHLYKRHIMMESDNHPVLMSEPTVPTTHCLSHSQHVINVQVYFLS